jgi:hypothetical protein
MSLNNYLLPIVYTNIVSNTHLRTICEQSIFDIFVSRKNRGQLMSPYTKAIRLLLAVVLTCTPVLSTQANAENIVATTTLVARGVDAKTIYNVTSLVASEVDFMPTVDRMIEVEKAPTRSCLTSTTCLRGIARAAGANTVVTGSLAKSGDNFVLELLMYDDKTRKIVRKDKFTLASNPSALADGMTAVVQAIVLGKTTAEKAAEEPTMADFSLEEDDFDFEPGPISTNNESDILVDDPFDALLEETNPEDVASAAAVAEQIRRTEEANRLAEAAARAEVERRVAAQAAAQAEAERLATEAMARAEAAQLAAEEAAAQAEAARRALANATAAPEEELEFDNMFSFSTSSSEAEPVDFEDPDAPSLLDLDDEPAERTFNRRRPTKPTPVTKVKKPKKPRAERTPSDFAPQINLRGGVASYHDYTFITVGGEFFYPVHENIMVAVGIETYSVNREIPIDLQPLVMKISEWNTLFPLNLGAIYKLDRGNMKPYAGAEIITVNYFDGEARTVDSQTPIDKSWWATGLRARIGVDYFVSDRFGFNVNLAYGGWRGDAWGAVASSNETIGDSGAVPQFSAGTVISF